MKPGALEPHPMEPLEPDTRAAERRPGQLPKLDFDDHESSKNYWWVWLLLFALIAYGCYKLYDFENAKKDAVASKKGMGMRPHNLPVGAASARTGNMPVYLQGLGTVTAYNTVTVKTRIDGQLTTVGFKEGQFVHAGDVLATIDARPYQVALNQAQGTLEQANGNLTKDQAAL